jgi:hypothetical protein
MLDDIRHWIDVIFPITTMASFLAWINSLFPELTMIATCISAILGMFWWVYRIYRAIKIHKNKDNENDQ